ncbi:MAG: hypothetical protein QG654_538 [Patescibacteria group bacterium]|nr:hypothetical protein [Patescibacteria group bacterium]
MMRDRITSTSNLTKERRKKSFVKILWILLSFVVFLIGLAFLSHLNDLLIKDVSVKGNEILQEEDIQKEAFKILSKKRFLVFAGENRLIYSKGNLEEGLKKAFPRILSIEINIEGKKLLFNIVERERAHLWCGEEPPTYDERLTERECYFLDNSGFIFDKSPSFSSGVYFTFYSKIENDNPIGQYILGFDFLKDIDSLINGVNDQGFPVHSLVAREGNQYELLFNMSTVSRDFPKLLFTSDQSIGEVYNKFMSIVEEDPFKTDFLEKPNRLEYIDARFKNRIFYRFTE